MSYLPVSLKNEASILKACLDSSRSYWLGNILIADLKHFPDLEPIHFESILTAQKAFFEVCMLRSFNQRLSKNSVLINMRFFEQKIQKFNTSIFLRTFQKRSLCRNMIGFIEDLKNEILLLKMHLFKWKNISQSLQNFEKQIKEEHKQNFLKECYSAVLKLYYQNHFCLTFLAKMEGIASQHISILQRNEQLLIAHQKFCHQVLRSL